MIFFTGVSPRIMIRILFPYFLGLIAVIAVLLAYLLMTDNMSDRIASIEDEQISQVTGNLIRLNCDLNYSDAMFTRFQEGGIEFHHLRPYFQDCFGLDECVIAYPLAGNEFERNPYNDTLAASALNNNIPYMRFNESELDESLTVFYPIENSNDQSALVRITFSDLKGTGWLNEYKYNFAALSVAVLILILIPGLIMGLAEFRRRVEMKGYFEEGRETERTARLSGGELLLDFYPSSLMDGPDSPALFKLDSNNEIVHMNSAAESLIDIPLNDAIGMQFHALPCFIPEEMSSFEYPEAEGSNEFVLNLINSEGFLNHNFLRIESLNDSGFAVFSRGVFTSDHDAIDKMTSHPETDEFQQAQALRKIADPDIQKAIDLAEDGRKLSGIDTATVNHFSMISRTLTDIRQNILRSEKEQSGVIDISAELEKITSALNDVLPDRVAIEVEASGFLPKAECSLSDFSQIIKEMVFHSLESVSGPVRIRIGARNVPSPVTDPVFSVKCDGSVARSVSVSYCDGTRIPVFLKEALLDPETDTAGIQRDFGSHVSSLAAILARLDLHPVFTEGSTGTTLNMLFNISESSLFDISPVEPRKPVEIGKISIAICDASSEVRNSVSAALISMGMDVNNIADLDHLFEEYIGSSPDYLVLDASVLEELLEETISILRIHWPDLRIIFTKGSSDMENKTQIDGVSGAGLLRKPYSPDELLDFIELLKTSDST